MIKQIVRYDWFEFNDLEIEYIDKDKWKIAKDFKFRVNRTNEIIVIREGFVTNLASVPRILRSIYPRSPKLLLASCIHDYLYEQGIYDRKTCDLIFKDLMKIVGVKKKKYKVMELGVRLFGWLFYKGKGK
jgi:hypothetical protein